MLLPQFKVYQTDNNETGKPELGRLIGLARRWFEREEGRSPNAEEQKIVALKLLKKYREVYSEGGGVCAGMVCNWAFNYLSSNNPESPVNLDEASRLQRHMSMTKFKREVMDKEDTSPTAIDKKDNRWVAMRKASDTVGLSHNVMKHGVFADGTTMFVSVMTIFSWVDRFGFLPFQLSFSVENNMSNKTLGRHALGLLRHISTFYVLEPNLGLYKFGNRAVAEQNFTNHLIEIGARNLPWTLSVIAIRRT